MPIYIGIQVRYGCQHVKGIAALGCERGICFGRSMQVETEIFRQYLALEDVIQQSLVARSKNDGVVRNVGILPARAEIPDEQSVGKM